MTFRKGEKKLFSFSVNSKRCFVCGRKFDGAIGQYCSFQCDFIAYATRKKFYHKKDLR